MSGALGDLLAALALVAVVEGLVLALMSRRIHDLLAQMAEIDPERVRWGGLALAGIGTLAYLLLRG
ncbi:MAG: DUF2065 family protein [Pseudomonadota bacterium]